MYPIQHVTYSSFQYCNITLGTDFSAWKTLVGFLVSPNTKLMTGGQ